MSPETEKAFIEHLPAILTSLAAVIVAVGSIVGGYFAYRKAMAEIVRQGKANVEAIQMAAAAARADK